MTIMIQRRTLLSALPFVFAAACARAQGTPQPVVKPADMTGMSEQTLSDLTGGVGKVVWLDLSGTVRLIAANANARPATLKRAIMLGADGTSARIFDVWQDAAAAPVSAPSLTRTRGQSATGPNEAGMQSVWLSRAFVHPALTDPIELSRLSTIGARVMAIDATQIWLVEGGIGAAPSLTTTARVSFDAWQSA